jgi:hypothetical protein
LFVFLIQAIATVSLRFMIDGKSHYIGWLVGFIIGYPLLITILFFVFLWFKREVFYGQEDLPGGDFVRILLHKVEKIEVRQEAQLDADASYESVLATVKKLTALGISEWRYIWGKVCSTKENFRRQRRFSAS